MATTVFVNVNGMVQHNHPGVKGWGKQNMHDPARKHQGNLHEEHEAASDEVLNALSEGVRSQYLIALEGTSYMANNKAASRERRVAASADSSVCDARCTNANPETSCDCTCLGANHGNTFVAEEAVEEPVAIAPRRRRSA